MYFFLTSKLFHFFFRNSISPVTSCEKYSIVKLFSSSLSCLSWDDSLYLSVVISPLLLAISLVMDIADLK